MPMQHMDIHIFIALRAIIVDFSFLEMILLYVTVEEIAIGSVYKLPLLAASPFGRKYVKFLPFHALHPTK